MKLPRLFLHLLLDEIKLLLPLITELTSLVRIAIDHLAIDMQALAQHHFSRAKAFRILDLRQSRPVRIEASGVAVHGHGEAGAGAEEEVLVLEQGFGRQEGLQSGFLHVFGHEDAAAREELGGEWRLDVEGDGGGGEGNVGGAGKDVSNVRLAGAAVKVERHVARGVGGVAEFGL